MNIISLTKVYTIISLYSIIFIYKWLIISTYPHNKLKLYSILTRSYLELFFTLNIIIASFIILISLPQYLQNIFLGISFN